MTFELIRFPDPAALARTVADRWLDEIAPQEQPQCVALSGGRISRQFFSSVAERSQARQIPLNRVHFFWADERCVPPDDPESNFAMAQELLFGPLNIAPEQVHRIKGELDPNRAAAEAEVQLTEIVRKNTSGEPSLDLVFLGMGEDGHVASLFPGEPAELEREKAVYRPVKAPKPPPARITLDYGILENAEKVWVLASGSGKENALAESLREDGKTPLAKVLQKRANTLIFSDIAV